MVQDHPLVHGPRAAFPSIDQLLHVTSVEGRLAVVGNGLWVVTYLVILRQAARDRAPGIPMVAVACNITWEIAFGLLGPHPDRAMYVVHGLWVVLDIVILAQAFWFGCRWQRVPVIAAHYAWVVTGTVVLAGVGEVLYQRTALSDAIFPDRSATELAFMINLLMSVLFVGLALARPGGIGLSIPAAWTKMLATAGVSLANAIAFARRGGVEYVLRLRVPGAGPGEAPPMVERVGASTLHPGFYYYLFLTILLFDLTYLILLSRARRQPAEGHDA